MNQHMVIDMTDNETFSIALKWYNQERERESSEKGGIEDEEEEERVIT